MPKKRKRTRKTNKSGASNKSDLEAGMQTLTGFGKAAMKGAKSVKGAFDVKQSPPKRLYRY